MGKLRVLSGRQVCRILAKHGFKKVRQKGDHIIMQRPGPPTCTVPVPDHKTLATGTLMSIIRQCGLPRAEFEV
jgi:predicted RNA binding protein YcfA (HicA-like mRNA interferase family)